MIELARRPRKTVRELAEVRGLNGRQVEKFASEMIAALRHAVGHAPPPPGRAAPLRSSLEPTVDFLVLCLRAVSAERSISAGILATRADLGTLAAFGDQADVAVLTGWRRSAAGEALLAALRGEAVARIIPSTREVELRWEKAEYTLLAE
jgi:ribonuclease D